MKTLDEVIKALEYCTGFDFVRCQDCPGYSEPDCGVQNDALHYLKHDINLKLKENETLRDMLNTEIARYQEAVANCNAVETKYMLMVKDALRNDPLSWEELKQMVFRPVWIETTTGNREGWYLLHGFVEEDTAWFHDVNGCVAFGEKLHYGKKWNAYRKERTDAETN